MLVNPPGDGALVWTTSHRLRLIWQGAFQRCSALHLLGLDHTWLYQFSASNLSAAVIVRNIILEVPNRPLRSLLVLLSGLVFVAGAAKASAQEMMVELDPADAKIEFTLAASFHTVHGTFQLKSGTIDFNPATGAASGVVIANAISAYTGNQARDRKMHGEVLESQRYPEVRFSPTKISGWVAGRGDFTVQVEGMFRLHGKDHPITLTVPVQISGGEVTASSRFIVPYAAWGLKNPSTFLLHVSDKVQLDVMAKGHIAE